MKLRVYKASAGSGKTYTLASEYLRLALSERGVRQSFWSILAVTFTNKATEEMKSRILSLLDALAKGEQPALSNDLTNALNCSPNELKERALRLRGSILHHYSDFSILTIDRFFQQILQAFVREAGLRPGYTVELDSARLLDEAVAKVMEDAGSDAALHGWITRLMEDNINAGKSWDVSPRLRTLGQEVFKESYLYFSDDFHKKLTDKDELASYIKKVEQLAKDFEQQMAAISNRTAVHLQQCELSVSDFKYGDKGVAGYLLKLKTGVKYEPSVRAINALNNVDEWYSKTSARSIDVKSAYHQLNSLLNEAITLWNNQGKSYNTAVLLLKNFKLLGLLSDISLNIQQIAGEENLLLISNSVHLLSRLIGTSETPFIYEKAGLRYRHFMIDEFQDTSEGQWRNFYPLLHNSLAEGNFNMVVGDVKQSIYRWRNGDWKILGHRLSDDFSVFGIDEQELSANWRSDGVVIGYNNELFTQLAAQLQASINEELESVSIPKDKQELLQSMMSKAYSNVAQHYSPKTSVDKGFVSMEFIDGEKPADVVLEKLPSMIADLQDRGYQPSDIAILVRKGIEGQQVADTLLTHKLVSGDTQHCFDVISQDSLFIANSSVVKLLVSILRLAITPDDAISQAFLAHELALRASSESANKNMHSLFSSALAEDDKRFIASLVDQSLLDAFEQAVQYFRLNERIDDLPFLQELHDVVLSYSSGKLSSIASFLSWWDEKGSATKVLAANDKQNAIKILTIHKSKGLQFKVVIVPFCSWGLVPKNDSILWLSPQVEPFNEMEHIPVNYSKELSNTIFYEDYFNEKTQSYVDNLNLLYVAFTRAEKELHAMVPIPTRSKDETIAGILENVTTKTDGNFRFGELTGEREGQTIRFGTKYYIEKLVERAVNNSELSISSYPSSRMLNKLKLRYESQDFFTSEDVSMTPRAYGSLMHRIFSNIRTLADVDMAINNLHDEGLIEEKDKTFYTEKVNKALAFTPALSWFSDEWVLKNEAEFLLPKQEGSETLIRRPDRVMVKDGKARVIDYKFGTLERKSYQRQVLDYMQGLQQMGYAELEGYIWYVDLEKIEEVKL